MTTNTTPAPAPTTPRSCLGLLLYPALIAFLTWVLIANGHAASQLDVHHSGWWAFAALAVVVSLPFELFGTIVVCAGIGLGLHWWAPPVADQQYWAAISMLVLVCFAILAHGQMVTFRRRRTTPAPVVRRHRGRLVGLSGYARAGKDTAAEELMVAEPTFQHRGFSLPLKAIAYDLNPWITHGPTTIRLQDLIAREGWTEAKKRPEVRQFLQNLGDSARRHISDDVWIDAAMNNLPDGDVVITDVRYPNEVAAITAAGGLVVRIDRPGNVPPNNHATETALADFDFEHRIVNDDTPQVLGRKLRQIVAAHLPSPTT